MNLKLNASIDSVYDSLTEFTNQLNKDLNIIEKNESKAVFEIQFGDNWSGLFYIIIKVFNEKDGVLISFDAYGKTWNLKKPLDGNWNSYEGKRIKRKYLDSVITFLNETFNDENLTPEPKPVQPKKNVVDEDIVDKTPEIKETEKNKENIIKNVASSELNSKSKVLKIAFFIFLALSAFLIFLHIDHNEVMMKRYGDNLGELYQEPLSFFDYLVFSITIYFFYKTIK